MLEQNLFEQNKPAEIEEILLPEAVIQKRVKELGSQISSDYQGKDLHLVALLKGAMVFLADFSRTLKMQTTIDFMVVSSYVSARSSGEARILKDLEIPIKGRDILVVEDIIDNGITLQAIMETLRLRKPASMKICTLLDKSEARTIPIKPDYNGFTVPNKFLVGYGLDFEERYRNLPYVGVLKKEVYERA
jgi:hypoxanthine phosphoribosyltransferase